MEDKELKIYELGYLLTPNLAEDEVRREYGNLKDAVAKHGGEMISEEIPKKIPLAYAIEKVVSNVRQKFTSAYFGWIKFTLGSGATLEIKKKLAENEYFVRYLLFKTVRESTVAGRKFAREIPYRRPPVIRKREEPTTPINKEEIDKEIEAMVKEEVKSL